MLQANIKKEDMLMEMDLRIAERVLDEYENCQNIKIPDGIHVDHEREQFLRGYFRGKQMQEYENRVTEDEIRRQIVQTRSKYCEPILELLAQEGELYHGDLAEKMEISPSGLNAIIKKMQESEFPIIKTNQIGKYKIYSLPDRVKEYILNKYQTKLPENNGYEVFPNLLLSLQRFIDHVGPEWREQLNLELQGIGTMTERKGDFKSLMEAVFRSYGSEEFDEFKKILKNEVLVYLLEDYIKKKKECEQIIEELKQKEGSGKMARMLKEML